MNCNALPDFDIEFLPYFTIFCKLKNNLTSSIIPIICIIMTFYVSFYHILPYGEGIYQVPYIDIFIKRVWLSY